MKKRHIASIRLDAQMTLKNMGIPMGADFHELLSDKVQLLIAAAIKARYQKPKNANGSRARYFHDRLQRHARMKD